MIRAFLRPSAVAIGVVAAAAIAASAADAQTSRRSTRKPPPPRVVTEPATVACPSPLGLGFKTRRNFCDVLTGRDPAKGILITLPPHRGEVVLKFDLHNRHTYYEDEVRAKKAFASYTSSIGVLTMDNTLLTRAVVAGEFRRAVDLFDRIGGGAGPGGV